MRFNTLPILNKPAICAVLLLAAPLFAHAAELKIVDNMGLTRAVKEVSESGAVTVELRRTGEADGSAEMKMDLSNVDGIASDINGVAQNSSMFSFQRVPAGTWKIKSSKKNVSISVVKISPQ